MQLRCSKWHNMLRVQKERDLRNKGTKNRTDLEGAEYETYIDWRAVRIAKCGYGLYVGMSRMCMHH